MKKNILLIACSMFLFSNTGCSKEAYEPFDEPLVSKVNGVFNYPFMGFGYNQNSVDITPEGENNPIWTEERFQIVEERVRAIKPGLVRIPIHRQWYNPSLQSGDYDWSTPEMKGFYRFMDIYKEMGVKVLTGWWHVTTYEDDKNGYKNDDTVTAFVDFIEYMFRVKGYDNIAFLQPSNEPYGVGTTWSDWSMFIKNTYAECERRGLPTDRLCGPDSWDDWIGLAAQYNKDELASYNFHFYFDGTASTSHDLGLYNQLMEQVGQVGPHDPSNKPIVCGECGAIKGAWLDWPVYKPEDGIYCWDYMYGVYLIDYAIQSMRAGVAASLVWSLYGFEQNKDGGMWSHTGNWGGFTLRPWYYSWSLLCRYFPEGAKCLDMQNMSSKIKVGGVQIGNGDYSFVVTNLATYDDELTIELPDDSKKSYYVYRYTENNQGDGESLSLPYEKIRTTGKLAVNVPINSAIFMTTMEPIN